MATSIPSIPSSSFEIYNVLLAPGKSQVVPLAASMVNSMNDPNPPYMKPFPADALMISVVGESGAWAGVRIDSNVGDFFNVPTGQTLTFRVPIGKQIEIKNTSNAQVNVSVGFIRGGRRF